MMVSDEMSSSLSKSILTKDELEKMPVEIRGKYEEFFNEYLQVKALYETLKMNSDGTREEFEQKIIELTEKYQDELSKAQSALSCSQELGEQLSEARQDNTKLTETIKRYETEILEYRKDRSGVIDERDSLIKMVDRRNFEVERMQDDINSLKNQLQNAIAQKFEALSKYQEVQHKEVNLEFKEKRIEQERQILQNQIDMLTSDLNRNIQELSKTRSETTTRCLTVETKLHEKTEELNIANSQIAHLTETNASINSRIEEMSQQILQHNEEFTKMMEKYKKELAAKDKLAELYKNKAEETLEEHSHITSLVSELRATAKEYSDAYGKLETEKKQQELQFQHDIEEKAKEIEDFKNELKRANELLKAAQQENIDIAVEKLCPTAASTSKLIKSGKSLTEIYTLYVNAVEELQAEKKNHEQLKLRFSEVFQEIQEKAPIIQRTEIELEKATEANHELQIQLENVIKERVEIRNQMEGLMMKVKKMEDQNREYYRDRQDLSRQVCHLLNIVEQMRGGPPVSRDDSISSDISGNELITKRLVTFDSIQDMQSQNLQLLAVVRDLTTKLEETDEIKNHMERATHEAKVESVTRRYQEMQETTELQTRMMEKCIAQREHYKKLYNELAKKGNVSKNSSMVDNFMDDDTPSASNTSLNTAGLNSSIVTEKNKKISDLDQKIKDSERELKTLKEEYENYRKEKLHNDEMVNKQFDSLRSELREVSTLNCKLRAQVEHNDGQIKIQQKNMATYKKQIQTLEERNRNFESTIAKHEAAAAFLRDEALNTSSKFSRAEIIIEKLTQENRMLKDGEARLKAEREVLYRERQSQSLVLNNLELIKNSMERSESEGKMKMESRLDELTRECSALRRRLQEEQDRFRELSSHLERQTQTAKEKMEEERNLATKYREELEQVRADVERKSEKIDQLSKKLQESLTPTQGDNPVAQANKMRKELEIRLAGVVSEKEALDRELAMAREHAKQYCDMAESYEKQLNEINETYTEYKTRVEADLSETKKSEAQLKQRVNDLETEISLDLNNRQLLSGDTNSQLHKAQLDLKDALLKIGENNREIREVRERNVTLTSQLELAEQKYANEMIMHSNDIKTMAKLKEEMTAMSTQFEQLRLAKQSAEDKFNNGKTLWVEKQENLKKEKVELEERLADLDQQNAALHNQIQELSNKLYLNVSQSIDESMVVEGGDTSMNRSHVATEDEKSSEQLLQVIKYLRKEKDIAVAKYDILKSENIRLKSEMHLTQKKLDEAQETSISQPDNSTIALNSARHEDLLRKVETMNALTDSNRILREERDTFAVQKTALQKRVTEVEDELVPLQEKNRELETKNESLTIENSSLKTEATRWRQRANNLVEKSNKNSPDDFKRLQTERENLAKMLQQEKDQQKKTTEELQQIKQEKSKVDNEIVTLQRQLVQQQAESKRISDEMAGQRQSSAKMSQELLELKVKFDLKDDEMKKLSEEIEKKESAMNSLKEKENQIRKIAKRYKDQYLELKGQIDAGQTPTNLTDPSSDVPMPGEPSTSTANDNSQLEQQIQQLSSDIESVRAENSKLLQQNQELKAMAQKDDSFKTLLQQARAKMQNLTEKKDQVTRDMAAMATEHEQTLRNLKSQYESRIQRLEKEIDSSQNQRPGQSTKPASSTMEKGSSDASSRTANVKPMAGPSQQSATVQPWRGSSTSSETPLASIRPISHQQSRTAAVMPTTIVQNLQGSSSSSTSSSENSASSSPQAGPSTALVPPQQQVHTTGSQPGEASNSPTSSHADYMPTTSSATVVVAAVPPMGSSQNAAESSSQGQEDQNSAGESSIQVVTGGQPIAQAVALVSPRVEPQQPISQQNVDAPSTSAGSSSSSIPPAAATHHHASSTTGTKRLRDVEGDSSTSNDESNDKVAPQKRLRQDGVFQGVSESGLEVEYQVPTSSQRDQEDDAIVLSSEDEEDDDDEAMPDEGNAEAFENDGIENYSYGMERQDDEGPDIDDIQSSANNEVEIEDISEVPNQSSADAAVGQSSQASESSAQRPTEHQQQIQSISSGSGNGNGGEEAGPSTSVSNLSPSATSQWRQSPNSATSSRQQTQHLMLMNQTFQDETSDDRIVPSTPTLYRPRSDGFSEVVSSPHPAQVPHATARFTFGESSASTTTTRAMVEGMDETRVDLTDEGQIAGGRNVPNIAQQPSPGDLLINDSTSASTSSTSSSISTVIQQDSQQEQHVAGSSSQEESQVPEICITGTDDDYDVGASTSATRNETEIAEQQEDGGDGVSSEGEKTLNQEPTEEESSEADMLEHPQNLRTTRSGSVGYTRTGPSPPRGGRGMRSRGGSRIQPIVWNQDTLGNQARQQQQQQQQQVFSTPPTRASRARRGARGRAASSSNYGNMRY